MFLEDVSLGQRLWSNVGLRVEDVSSTVSRLNIYNNLSEVKISNLDDQELILVTVWLNESLTSDKDAEGLVAPPHTTSANIYFQKSLIHVSLLRLF